MSSRRRSRRGDPLRRFLRRHPAARRSVITAVLSVIVLSQFPLADAAFKGTTVNTGSTWSAPSIYDVERKSVAHGLIDYSDPSSGPDDDDPLAVNGDSKYYTTKTPPSSLNSARYTQFTMEGSAPDAVPLSAVTSHLSYASNNGAQVCVYLQFYRASTNTLLASTSSSSPYCTTSSARATITGLATYIPNTTVMSDLYIRVVAASGGSGNILAYDQLDVVGTMTTNGGATSTNISVFPVYANDKVDGTSTMDAWPLAVAGDSQTYSNRTAWAGSFSTTRAIQYTVPLDTINVMPSNATVSAVTLYHTWKGSNSSATVCYYVGVYSGSTAITTYGSGSPWCTSGSSYTTDTISLPAVNTAARANSLMLRLYYRSTLTNVVTVDDYFAVGFKYSAP